MITVVVPLYNKEEFISETLGSVLDQTFTNFELLVINDGSTDKSAMVVNSIEDQRLRLINIENSGVSFARNLGVKEAENEWIAFLDGDDWWAPTFLANMVAAIKRYPEHTIFASGRSLVFKEVCSRYYHEYLPNDGETAIVDYFKVISRYLPPINSSNAVLKKKLFSNIGNFRVGQKIYEDHDLWLRFCVHNPVVFVNKNLSFYRKTEEDTVSAGYYYPSDFIVYLQTLLTIKNNLSNDQIKWFKKYYNKFVLLTYIKNYKFYTKEEDHEVRNLAKKLMEAPLKNVLVLLGVFPYKGFYKFLKFFKR